MSFTFDSSVGGTSSNSYIALADYTDFYDRQPFTDDLPPKDQNTLLEKLAVASTTIIDQLDFVGTATNVESQALEFPRLGLVDRRGYSIDENVIPQELKDATCEMMVFLYQNQINNNTNNTWEQDLTSTSIGGSLNISYDGKKKPAELLPEQVKFFLKKIGVSGWISSSVVRIRRS